MQNYYAGIKITDGYLKFCVGSEDLKNQNTHKISMPKDISSSKLIDVIEAGFSTLLQKASVNTEDVNAVGVSIPATINYKTGAINCSSVIPLLNGLNIKEDLTKTLKKFVVVETEANIRAFAEYKIGQASNYKNFILIILDKKISAGIYVNGGLVRNKEGATAELGHIIIEPHGRKCMCSNRGCLEVYASSDAIIRYYKKYKRIRSSVNITIDDLYRLALKSDSAALDAFYRMGNYLGIALTNIINVTSPEAIIFAGEVSKALRFFLPAVESTLKARAYSLPLNGIVYKKSTLDENDELIGLLHFARDSYNKAYDLRIYDDIFVL
ncbi:MAG: ROK family protein [bacterium]